VEWLLRPIARAISGNESVVNLRQMYEHIERANTTRWWRPFPMNAPTSTLSPRQTSDTIVSPDDKAHRVNLLNWDGRGAPPGLFPPRGHDDDAAPTSEDRP
jgi:hypothetical protein